MITILGVSTIFLTVLTLLLSVAVFALARQIGVLHERIAPIGQQPTLVGLQTGQALPRVTARHLNDTPFVLGGPASTGRAGMLMFISADCPICKRTFPFAQALAIAHDIDLTLVGEGDVIALKAMSSSLRLGNTPVVTSQELLLLLQIGRLPTLVMLDSQGVITARDVANTRSQIEALIATLPAPTTMETIP